MGCAGDDALRGCLDPGYLRKASDSGMAVGVAVLTVNNAAQQKYAIQLRDDGWSNQN